MTQSKNRKIIGAEKTEYKGIRFKSKLEKTCYDILTESKLNFSYESEKIILWEGVKLTNIKCFKPSKIKYNKDLIEYNRALLNITYTPDFVIIKDNYKIYFDVKGISNDTYPIKMKMFLKYLENKKDEYNYMFFEPHNIRQIKWAVEYIKNL